MSWVDRFFKAANHTRTNNRVQGRIDGIVEMVAIRQPVQRPTISVLGQTEADKFSIARVMKSIAKRRLINRKHTCVH